MATPTFDTIEAQASYGIGLQVGQQLSESGLQGLLPEALVAGIADALEGKQPAVPVDVVHRALREIHERADAVRRERFASMAEDGVKYLEENREKDGVNSTETGLQFRVLTQGEGAIPARTDRVRVHYTGWLYKDGHCILESYFVSGNPTRGHATPKGIYGLTYKTRDATLSGEGYDSKVKYWMPFNRNVGLHDAPWRKTFGGQIYRNNGSHGCINLPPANAAKIYENVDKNTPVIVY